MYKKLFLTIGIICLFTACGKKQETIARPAFNSDSAYAYIEGQMAFGPRVPNSKAHNDCAVWLIQQLRAKGAKVELQRGEMPDYRGNMQQIYNIIAHFSTPEIASRPRILLGAHYDTRPWCDDIVLFDCEDMGTPRFYTGIEREDTWCLGSQLWATNYAKNLSASKASGLSAEGGLSSVSEAVYSFGIVLDMVGAPDASFPRELYSTQYARNYQQKIWKDAEQLGYGALFSQQQSYPITDDHYYVNYIAGIPCVDIIHYDIRNATGFASWWHTRNDDMSNISLSTLQAVGEVVMSQL